jgi:putative oxidoreductase
MFTKTGERVMSTNVATLPLEARRTGQSKGHVDARSILVPVGRLLYVAIFLVAGLSHHSPQSIGYAAQQGVPFAGVLVPFSGVLALASALSVLLGYKAKIGAWGLVLFLVPVTVLMHNFWAVQDPMMAQLQQAMFFKNVSMLGAALLIAHFGAGPVSLDSRAGPGARA